MATRKPFKTIVRRARFTATNAPAVAMQAIAQRFIKSQNERWARGENTLDQPAPPLHPKYARRKLRKFGSDKRDMKKTGQTVRGNRVLRASPGRATAGNYDPVAQKRINLNSKYLFWGVSPRNREDFAKEAAVQFKIHKLVKIEQI